MTIPSSRSLSFREKHWEQARVYTGAKTSEVFGLLRKTSEFFGNLRKWSCRVQNSRHCQDKNLTLISRKKLAGIIFTKGDLQFPKPFNIAKSEKYETSRVSKLLIWVEIVRRAWPFRIIVALFWTKCAVRRQIRPGILHLIIKRWLKQLYHCLYFS